MDSNVNSAQGPDRSPHASIACPNSPPISGGPGTRGARSLPPARLPALAADRAQPGADAAAGLAGDAGRSPPPTSGSCAIYDAAIAALDAARSATRHLVAAHVPGQPGPDRLLLRRVRAAPVAADLRRRPRRARRRSLQGSERPRHAADRRRLHVSAGLLPPDDLAGRLAAGSLRAAQLGRRADRAGDDARRQALRRRRAARQPQRARVGVAGPARAREAVSARHRSRGERAVGSRAVGAALRRRPRDAHPAGDHPRHRRRARAAGARLDAGGLAPERRPRRVRRAAAHPRPDRAGPVVRRRRSATCGGRRCSRRTRRCRPATTRSRSTWSRRISPALGHARHATATSSWRSGTTTTAAARCST